MENELLNTIHKALRDRIAPDTSDSLLFVQEVAQTAAEAAQKVVEELLEANRHLQETVRRLSRVDTGTTAS